MKAFALASVSGKMDLEQIELEVPVAAESEVLVAVRAAGVTPTELHWYPSTHNSDGSARSLAVPGHEFSGIVAAVGPKVTTFRVGDDVFGMNDWFSQGATAEFCIAPESSLVRKPQTISHVEAATTPISALTAWQGLLEHASVKEGERVLIVGAAGSVGLLAVQIAARTGCHVIASAALEDAAILTELGCEQVLDYRTNRFEERLTEIDVVFDAVGADTLLKAKRILKPGGRMVTIAADAEGSEDPLIKAAFFIVEPSASRLKQVADLVEGGALRIFVKAVLDFEHARDAYLKRSTDRGLGKVVLQIQPVADTE